MSQTLEELERTTPDSLLIESVAGVAGVALILSCVFVSLISQVAASVQASRCTKPKQTEIGSLNH